MKPKPKYGAFVKINGQWQRRYPALSYDLATARLKFQNWLLAGVLGQREPGETERGLRRL